MDFPSPDPASSFLARLPRLPQWIILIVLSALLAGALELAGIPAALLIGPMIAAILAGTNGATIRVPRAIFMVAQGVVGAMIAAALKPDMFVSFMEQWPLVLGSVFATLAASSFLGWLISRWKILPGTTAVWGSSPGAANAMVFMADAFGADARLVAFMRYLRVIMVTAAAVVIARLWETNPAAVVAPAIDWFPSINWPAFGTTVLVAVGGGVLGRLLRLPSANFMGPLFLGIGLQVGAGLPMQLPEWLLAASYVVIGWSVGLSFTRPIVRHAARVLPQIALSILALIAFCGGLAFVISHELGVDPLTAYLATSPGGLDSVAIIAAASNNVNLSFVMALQMARLLIVIALGPPLARLITRWSKT